MIVFPNCKINLGLHVTGKRNDGFHDLDTVFYPLAVQDALEFIPSSEFIFSQSGLAVPGRPAENIVWKAWNLLRSRFADLPSYSVHLHKVIPMGAGLGGGSSDASFTLRALNELAGLKLTQDALLDLSKELGSDCPFFLMNQPCAGRGRGEILQPIALDLSRFHFVVIHPGIHVSTQAAFASMQPEAGRPSPSDLVKLPIEQWREQLTNDFQDPVGKMHPEILDIITLLYDAGAVYAAMSGSGSASFGIFHEQPGLPQLPEHWSVFHI